MTTKKRTTSSDRPHLDLDAILETRTPDFTLGGIDFEGRPIGWTVALAFDEMKPEDQATTLVRALQARCDDPDAIDDAWIETHLTRAAIDAVVGILFRGEAPAGAPNRAARRAASKSS